MTRTRLAVLLLAAGPAAAPAADPDPPVQGVRIVTNKGESTQYLLPADASPEMRAAFKLREFAERDVVIAEELQKLKLDVVVNERRLESLRAAQAQLGPPGPPAGSIEALRAMSNFPYQPPGLSPPVGGFPSGGGGAFGFGGFGGGSSLKFALSFTLAADATAERAQLALDRLMDAQLKTRRLLDEYNRQRQMGARPLARPLTEAAAGYRKEQAALAGVVEEATADREKKAEAADRAARQEEQQARDRYRAADPADRESARAAWLTARDRADAARKAWDEADAAYQKVRDFRRDADRVAVENPPVVPAESARPVPAERPLVLQPPAYRVAPETWVRPPAYGGGFRP